MSIVPAPPLRRILLERFIPLVLLATAACQVPDSGFPTEATHAPTVLMASMSSTVPDPCNGETHYRFYTGCWGNGATIRLQPVSQDFSDAFDAAVADWNQYLTQDGAAPRFGIAGSGAPFDVRVNAVESGSVYCGKFAKETLDTVSIFSSTNSNCTNGHTGAWGAAMRHELAGILGWNEKVEEASPSMFEDDFTTQCVLSLAKGEVRTINGSVCVHEAEGALLAYRGLENTVGSTGCFETRCTCT